MKYKKERPHDEVSLAFNCPNQYSYFKKGSDSVDFYCNILKFKISNFKNRLKSKFLMSIDV